MVYISCNVSTLARDLVQLAKVYQVDYLQSVDMFPQTARCEVVVKLTRNKKGAWDKITLDFCSTLKTDKRRNRTNSFGNKPKLSKN